jgi:potassium-transporting ATPase KdpC subunit
MFQKIKTALILLVCFTVLTGVIYPLAITGIAQIAFPSQANGSLIIANGQARGSALIGQSFDDPKYFWGRLSATSPVAYNAAASSGSNLGPLNPDLVKNAQARIAALKQADPQNAQPIPVDLVTTSGSGLDPHISVAAAQYQSTRVARVRGLSESRVRTLVEQFTEDRQFGILGEPRVNVLQLNLALDEIK